MYIGATLQQVKRVIHSGKLRIASGRPMHSRGFLDVKGAGTKRLSKSLARKLINSWWNAGPGAKIVVGWVHSDALELNATDFEYGHRLRPIRSNNRERTYVVKAVSVTRPNDRAGRTVERVFYNLLSEAISRVDNKFQEITSRQHSIYTIPVFTMEAYPMQHARRVTLSTFFVWPGGIIENKRLSDILNKVSNKANALEARRAYRFMLPDRARRDYAAARIQNGYTTSRIRRQRAALGNGLERRTNLPSNVISNILRKVT